MCRLPTAPPVLVVSFAPTISWGFVALVLLACLMMWPKLWGAGLYWPPTISRRQALRAGIPGFVCLVIAATLIVVLGFPTGAAIGAWRDHLLATLPASCENAIYAAKLAATNRVGLVTALPAFGLWVAGTILTGWAMYQRGNLRWRRK